MQKLSRYMKPSGKKGEIPWKILKNTVATIECHHCHCEIFKNWKFYKLTLIIAQAVHVALCFDCFNKWKRDQITI